MRTGVLLQGIKKFDTCVEGPWQEGVCFKSSPLNFDDVCASVLTEALPTFPKPHYVRGIGYLCVNAVNDNCTGGCTSRNRK